MRERNDDELVALCKDGSHQAFNTLVRRYQTQIYRMLYRFLGNEDDALDVAQEVFVRAWRGISDFRGESQVFTWLYRIAANLALNHIRKRKLREFLHLDDLAENIEDTDETDPQRLLEAEETRSAVERAVSLLPEKQKAVFVMRYYENMSYSEIAAILKKSVGGLKANYYHATKKIEEFLNNAL